MSKEGISVLADAQAELYWGAMVFKRKPALAALAMLLILAAHLPGSYASDPIDLNAPGALETIKRDRPEHYAKIQRILAEAPRYLDEGPRNVRSDAVATWMRTQFQARDVHYTDIVLTSLPPKKRFQFSLDDASYVLLVTLPGYVPPSEPARKRAPLK
jgi:hypothetical protein